MTIPAILAVVAATIAQAAAINEDEATVSGSLFLLGSLLVVVSGVIGLGTQILIAAEVCRKRNAALAREQAPRAFRDMSIRPLPARPHAHDPLRTMGSKFYDTSDFV